MMTDKGQMKHWTVDSVASLWTLVVRQNISIKSRLPDQVPETASMSFGSHQGFFPVSCIILD